MSLRKYGVTAEIRAQKIAQGLRWCSGHKDFIVATEFSGTSGYCKQCVNRYQQHHDTSRWKHHLHKKYGVTPEWYNAKLVEQGGVCAICERPERKRRLGVDHDHLTGEPRGLLCQNCNKALERMETFPDWADRVKRYLTSTIDKV